MNLKPISVLHIATAMTWRGGEQQVAYLVLELMNKNIHQFVLCSSGSAMEAFCSKNNVAYFTAKKKSSFDISYSNQINKICREQKIDIIHAHDSHAHTFAILAVVLFRCKSKIIVSRRVDFAIGKNPFSRFKYNHDSVKRILCVSEEIRRITMNVVKDNTRVTTVYSGVDLTKFSFNTGKRKLHESFNLPDKIKIIANISAIAPHKDYFTFVDVVEILKQKLTDISYFIIGEGPEREQIEKYIHSKNLQDTILLTGFRTDITDIFPELNLLLITSETEGLGTTILDAFACGVSVVATAAGGIPELVIHEKTGLLATVKDAAGIAGQVVRMLTDEDLRKRVVDEAAIHLKKFSKENTAMNTLREYSAVAGSAL